MRDRMMVLFQHFEKIFGVVAQVVKILIASLLITGILGFSTFGFLSAFIDMSGEKGRMIQYVVYGVFFVLILGLAFYGRFSKKARKRYAEKQDEDFH